MLATSPPLPAPGLTCAFVILTWGGGVPSRDLERGYGGVDPGVDRRGQTKVPIPALYSKRNGSRTCLVQTFGRAGTDLERAAGRDLILLALDPWSHSSATGGTSLIRTPPPIGPYSSPVPRDLW